MKSNSIAGRGVAWTEGNPEDAFTNEIFAFMATGNKLIDSGTAALSRRLGEYRRRRRQQVFDAKVVHALAELGLSPANFDARVKDLLTRVCTGCFEQDGENANAHALALEFFLRLALEYPHLMDKAVKFQGVSNYLDDLGQKVVRYLDGGLANFVVGLVDLHGIPPNRVDLSAIASVPRKVEVARNYICNLVPKE